MICVVKHNVDCPAPQTNSRLLDKLVGEYIKNQCVTPSFIFGHPQLLLQPKKSAYTELNDPFDQRERFEEQTQQKAAGYEEAQGIDETFR
ncbi:lysyl-tRNA synthetase [Puccinia graminis f. sp. tritici]|uniref:Lysyl-tRNA synthetase n=1 Tax=Puccinia graminis f. sp. tritici TaxID=56615 RepID=A0A5B0QYN1_PUCGR|nr:lysyl-tRNA synthetase [Puccinia graminis f. sp. tritici]